MVTAFIALSAYLITMLVRIVIAFFRCQWRAGITRAVLLVVAIPLTAVGAVSGDYVHLAAAFPWYWLKIAQTEMRPVTFPWGDQAVSVLDGIQLRILIYDDTGKLRTGSHIGRGDDAGLWVSTRHLAGNFFIESLISCDEITACSSSR